MVDLCQVTYYLLLKQCKGIRIKNRAAKRTIPRNALQCVGFGHVRYINQSAIFAKISTVGGGQRSLSRKILIQFCNNRTSDAFNIKRKEKILENDQPRQNFYNSMHKGRFKKKSLLSTF